MILLGLFCQTRIKKKTIPEKFMSQTPNQVYEEISPISKDKFHITNNDAYGETRNI